MFTIGLICLLFKLPAIIVSVDFSVFFFKTTIFNYREA